VKELNPEARAAGKTLIAEGTAGKLDRTTFSYGNHRRAGNALATIEARVGQA
jgi:hypothetical protein